MNTKRLLMAIFFAFGMYTLAAEHYPRGDIDGSGVVDATDIQLVINKALGLSVAYDCDIDGSGTVDATDIQLVINAALGINIDDMSALATSQTVLASGIHATVLDSANYFRSDSAIGLDSHGHVHIAYRTGDGRLGYANNIAGFWRVKQQWGQLYPFATYTALKVDHHDNVHICSTGPGTGEDLLYFTNASNVWVGRELDNNFSVGLESDMCIDSNDKVHISYWQWNGNHVRYATNASGDWVTEEVAPYGLWTTTSLTLDSLGSPHVYYMGRPDADAPKVVESIKIGDGSWTTTTTLVPTDAPWWNGFSVRGTADTIYAANKFGVISKNSAGWQQLISTATLLPNADPYYFEFDEDALAIDSAGHIHYTFVRADSYGPTAQLYYVTNALGSWQIAELDNWTTESLATYDGGLFPPCITVDQSGAVHIVNVKASADGTAALQYITFLPANIAGLLQSSLPTR